MNSRSEGRLMVYNHAHYRTGEKLTNDRRRTYLRNIPRRLLADSMDIDQVTLPDDVLLAIFHFCMGELLIRPKEGIHAWQSLVHVCRQWRTLVFASPRRLNLRLYCTPRTTRDMLNVWPALPLLIWGSPFPAFPPEGVDNIIALLQHSDRVCDINLSNIPSLDLEKITAAMQKPFPELTGWHRPTQARLLFSGI